MDKMFRIVLFPIMLLWMPLTVSAQSQSNYSVGESQFCSLQDGGQVNCILRQGFDRLVPPSDLPELTAVTTGDAHACGITFTGEAICWGENNFGQLNVPSVDLPLVQINAGQNHTCAVDSAGAAVCWGLNGNRQLEPPDDAIFTQVDAAFTSSCGILTNGDITCWSTDTSRAPAQVVGPFVDLDISDSGVCGLVTDGSIRCSVGVNDISLLQNGPYTDIATTRDALCALSTEGILECELASFADTSEEDYPIGEQFSSIQSAETGFSGIGSSTEFNRVFGTTMCGERLDGTFQCWAESTLFPDLSESTPSQPDLVSEQRLDLDARIYGSSVVEIFWTPLSSTGGPVPLVEVFRNGESILTTDAAFSFFDPNASVNNTYQIRLVDDTGNIGPLSDPLTVDTQTRTVLFNGELPVTNATLVEEFGEEIFTRVDQRGLTIGFIGFWEVNPAQMSLVDGFEILLGGSSVGFTRSQLYVNTESRLGGRCFEILALDSAGTILDSASPIGRSCR